MKVYELIAKLESLPANMDVSITGESNNGMPFPIAKVSYDDPAEPGMTVLLIFDDTEISYNSDIAQQKMA